VQPDAASERKSTISVESDGSDASNAIGEYPIRVIVTVCVPFGRPLILKMPESSLTVVLAAPSTTIAARRMGRRAVSRTNPAIPDVDGVD
jgi:hypothetical protein